MNRHARWEICRRDDGKFYARFRASNGRIVFDNEAQGYDRKSGALHSIELVYGSAVEVGVVDTTKGPAR